MHLQVETYDSKQPGVGCLLLRLDRTVRESQENCCRCLDHRFGEDEFVPVAGTGPKVCTAREPVCRNMHGTMSGPRGNLIYASFVHTETRPIDRYDKRMAWRARPGANLRLTKVLSTFPAGQCSLTPGRFFDYRCGFFFGAQ